MIYFVGVLTLALLLIALTLAGRERHKRLARSSEAIHRTIYSSFSTPPLLEMSYLYGYPFFKIMFRSQGELEIATESGVNRAFMQEIDALCKSRGPRTRPFSADKGVYFTYEGWLEEQIAKDKGLTS